MGYSIDMDLKGEPRMQTQVEELAERISGTLAEDGHIEPLGGLHVHYASSTRRLHSVSQPGFCLIAQGSKEIFLANERYQYDPANYLLVTSELPIVSQIIEASPNALILVCDSSLTPPWLAQSWLSRVICQRITLMFGLLM